MDATSPRWKSITPSEFRWEQEALQHVRRLLPDEEPYRAWSNFQFIAGDGSINEVDLLVLAPHGLFLVEIKSRPGKLKAEGGTWTWLVDAKEHVCDNPLFLANKKTKRLRNLLNQQRACRRIAVPWVQPVVFLSAPGLEYGVDDYVAAHVAVRDDSVRKGSRVRGIGEVLTRFNARELAERGVKLADSPTAKAIARAIDHEAPIERTEKYRQVGDYRLGQLLYEGPNYQDWQGQHRSVGKTVRRIRIYTVQRAPGAVDRATIHRAAQREFQILEGIEHPGILRALDYHDTELGPALVFDHHPESVRLDHFLTRRGSQLDTGHRLHIVRQLAETLAHAHAKGLAHRALSPQSVLVVDPAAPAPRLQVINWQTGARTREPDTSSGNLSATEHLDKLVEEAAAVYVAPEALAGRPGDAQLLDIFSLGATAYHVFAGRPPADSPVALLQSLHEGKGLQLSATIDGVGEKLRELVQMCTDPDVTRRADSAAAVLELLQEVESELSAPDRGAPIDPAQAKAGDRLEGGLEVKSRLGQGSTAVVFLVTKEDQEMVLKVALDVEHDARLMVEGAVLEKLRHQFIVEIHEVVRVGGRVGLLLAPAGRETLRDRLRKDGRLHTDLLERFGEDLLSVVHWLEQQGVPHRDIKPDNLGIMPVGRGDRLHLVLFDFSLSSTPPEKIRAGTVPYLDPFLCLRRPPRWDLHAERFAAAMTLYEMATGTLPRWGDGRSDPAMLDGEATIEADFFDEAVRRPMAEFFAAALRRDPGRRFDNADEMLRAWRRVFAQSSRPAVVIPGESAYPDADRLAQATLETPLVELGLSPRALEALTRVNALRVADLLRTPASSLTHMRGVGHATRKEIVMAMGLLGRRFPDVHPGAGPAAVRSTDSGADEIPVQSVDLLAQQLVPAPRRGERGHERADAAVRAILGLDPLDEPREGTWPSQSEVARGLSMDQPSVSRALEKARQRWGRNRSITALRDELERLLDRHGRVMSAEELAEAILATRGSVEPGERRRALSRAVLRAALDAEAAREAPRWMTRRCGPRTLVAREGPVGGQRVLEYVTRLGQKADALVAEDPLPSVASVVAILQSVPPPEAFATLPVPRLVRLAAAASVHAAASARLELYPRGMPAARALRLSQGALVGAPALTVEAIRTRILSRYPSAGPIPDPPELDSLLAQAGLDHLVWDPTAAGGRGAYHGPASAGLDISSGSEPPPRQRTSLGEQIAVTPAVAQARELEDRLVRAARDGAYLALSVAPHSAARAQEEICRRFAVDRISVDATLIQAMRRAAHASGADWNVVLRADAAAPGSRDWQNLLLLVRRAMAGLEEAISLATRTVLLTDAGLLARYDQLSILDRLRERIGRSPSAPGPRLHGLWVLVPGDEQTELPMLDGKPIPVITRAEWARIPEPWLQNLHRAGTAGASPADRSGQRAQ